MTVSIVIPVKEWQNNLNECLIKCQELDFLDFEIILLPDSPFSPAAQGVLAKITVPLQVIPSGKLKPSHKRDIALSCAKGEFIAFIDDDAYPRRDWLKNALKYFSDKNVAAVVGPAVSVETDSLRQRISGRVFSSILVSGNFCYRYVPGRLREVDDYPSCNFIVRKSVMQELGGFDTNFWPGEDTKFCLEITAKLGKKIIYSPEVMVWHHRRRIFAAHLKQVAGYAIHRGYFVRRYPKTSFRVPFFLPSIFTLSLLSISICQLYFPQFRALYFLLVSAYLFLVLIFSLSNNLFSILLTFSVIILTHITYGIYFIAGLFSAKLKEEE